MLWVTFNFAVLVFPRKILGPFTYDPAVIAEGMKYIGIVCFSYVFFCGSNMLLASMRCVRNTGVGLACSVLGFCVNVFLNWILIFGHFGFSAMGLRGAAIGTLIARISEFGFSFFYVRFVDPNLKFRARDLLLWDRLLLGDFFKFGAPVILGDIIWGIAGSVQVAILGRLGSEILAANTTAANLHQFFGVVVYAIVGASGVIIGGLAGAKDIKKVKEYSAVLQVIFLCFGILTGAVIFFTKDLILDWGFPAISMEAHYYAIQFLTVFSITIVGTSYQMSVLTGIVRAGGATSFVLLNDLFGGWIIVIPSALLSVFAFHFPPVVTFACLKCDQIFKCPVAVIKLNRWNWMKSLTR